MYFKKRQARKKGNKPIHLISMKDAAEYVGITETELKRYFDIFKVSYYYPEPNQQPYVEDSAARCLKVILDK